MMNTEVKMEVKRNRPSWKPEGLSTEQLFRWVNNDRVFRTITTGRCLFSKRCALTNPLTSILGKIPVEEENACR